MKPFTVRTVVISEVFNLIIQIKLIDLKQITFQDMAEVLEYLAVVIMEVLNTVIKKKGTFSNI